MDLLKLLRLQWDRAIAIGAAILGLIALVLGYFGTSGTPHVANQMPYMISGGLFGIFCLTIAAVAWISADLRDEWRELRSLRDLVDEEMRSRRGRDGRERAAGLAAAYPTAAERRDALAMHSEGAPEVQQAAPQPAPRRRARKAVTAVEQ
jgi:hypothetical protein